MVSSLKAYEMAPAGVVKQPTDESWQEKDWEKLLAFIDAGTVVPIVGGDLAVIEGDGAKLSLSKYAAQCVAERLGVPTGQLDDDYPLNDVLCRYLQAGGDAQDLCYELCQFLRSLTITPPEALLELAQIT